MTAMITDKRQIYGDELTRYLSDLLAERLLDS